MLIPCLADWEHNLRLSWSCVAVNGLLVKSCCAVSCTQLVIAGLTLNCIQVREHMCQLTHSELCLTKRLQIQRVMQAYLSNISTEPWKMRPSCRATVIVLSLSAWLVLAFLPLFCRSLLLQLVALLLLALTWSEAGRAAATTWALVRM